MFIVWVVFFSFIVGNGLCLNKNPEDQSINEIVNEEIKPKLVNEHHYYLPQQTVFGSPGSSMGIDASKTSPPHITINPTTTLENHEQNTVIIEENPINDDDYIIPYSSYCVSETPSHAKVESELLLPSKDMLQKNVVLSGYIETPSKTSDDHHKSDKSNYVSISSDVQENNIFIGNTTSDI